MEGQQGRRRRPAQAHSQDEDLDVALLTVDPKDGKNIQDVLGGNSLGTDRGFNDEVKITGYPAGRDTPISCQNRTTKFSDTQLRIQCTDFEGGTSGSPWLADYDPQEPHRHRHRRPGRP